MKKTDNHEQPTCDHHHRSIAKAVSWRVLGSVLTFGIALAATGRLDLSAGVGAADFVLKAAVFYIHERVWNHIHWGKA